MYQIYKYLVYAPWLMLWTVANFLGVLLVAVFSQRNASRWFGGLWGRGLIYGIPATVRVTGREHIDSGASYIVVSNHLSLPITVVGADSILSPDGMDLYPGTARVVIHAPIGKEQVGKISTQELRDLAQSKVASSLAPPND